MAVALTTEQKIKKLKKAIKHLCKADALQQEVIEGDVCYENFQRIQNLVDDLEADVEELENGN